MKIALEVKMAAANNHGAVPAVDIAGLRKVVLFWTTPRTEPGFQEKEKHLLAAKLTKWAEFSSSI